MLLIATAAALAANGTATPEGAAVAERQAQAVVRIVKAARVRLGEGSAGGDQEGAVRETGTSDSEGRPQRLILVEFS